MARFSNQPVIALLEFGGGIEMRAALSTAMG
jgi:hypothetical protein